LVRNGGIATTLDAQTGKVLKRARLTGAIEDYYASPIGVDGKVYIASARGKVIVLRAAGDWEILAINDFDSDIYATPAISEGKMYIRTRNALYAIGALN
ncbi:MAG: pyrrolo-quinoline quinone, partial [Gemmatimonadetes bacterium]|nr:pyrrolo-quinoline quinone [Gemmatimonadota bacterium]